MLLEQGVLNKYWRMYRLVASSAQYRFIPCHFRVHRKQGEGGGEKERESEGGRGPLNPNPSREIERERERPFKP